jgi:hypothetical protein
MEPWLFGHLMVSLLFIAELGGISIILWILLPLFGDWLRSRRASARLLRHQRVRRRAAPAQLK